MSLSSPAVRRLLLVLLAALTAAPIWLNARDRRHLEVPHVYDGGGLLCYLGSLAMAVQDQKPEVTYEQVVRYARPGTMGSGPDVMPLVATRLGFRLRAAGRNGAPSYLVGDKMVQSWRRIPDEKAGEEALKDLLERGVAPIVDIEIADVAEDRAARGIPGPPEGSHIVVLVGLLDDEVLVNDPQFGPDLGLDLRIRKDRFLQAWKKRDFGLTFLERGQEAAPAQDALLVEALADLAPEPARLRWLADFLGDERLSMPVMWMNLGGNPLRRRVMGDWLKEEGQPEAGALLRQTADLYHQVGPSARRPVAPLLRKIADLEEKALLLLGVKPPDPPGVDGMREYLGMAVDWVKDGLTVEPGKGIGPLRVGQPLRVPEGWRAGPSGRVQGQGQGQPGRRRQRLEYRVFPDQGLLVTVNRRGIVQSVESFVAAHRTADGLGVGTASREVQEAMGRPPDPRTRERGLQYSGRGIHFTLERGRVVRVEVNIPQTR